MLTLSGLLESKFLNGAPSIKLEPRKWKYLLKTRLDRFLIFSFTSFPPQTTHKNVNLAYIKMKLVRKDSSDIILQIRSFLCVFPRLHLALLNYTVIRIYFSIYPICVKNRKASDSSVLGLYMKFLSFFLYSLPV